MSKLRSILKLIAATIVWLFTGAWMGEPRPTLPPPPKRMLDDEGIAKLAMDMAHGRVFGTWDIPAHRLYDDVSMVFMPLVFMDEEAHADLQEREVVHLYEYLDKAAPRSVNGYPSFFSMHVLSEGDWQVLLPKVRKIASAMEKAAA